MFRYPVHGSISTLDQTKLDAICLTLMISSVERGMASTRTQVTSTFFLLEIDVLLSRGQEDVQAEQGLDVKVGGLTFASLCGPSTC